MRKSGKFLSQFGVVMLLSLSDVAHAQLIDNTQATNTAKAGINKSLSDEIGAGRGNILTPGSSLYIIQRDPFRSIRRGRQLFQRKFTRAQGQGPNEGDGVGDLNTDIAIGAGMPTVALYVMDGLGDRQVPEATLQRGRTAATHRICLALDCGRCWPMRLPVTCVPRALSRSSRHVSSTGA